MTPARPVTTWSDAELHRAARTTFRTLIVPTPDVLRDFLKALGAVHPQEHAIATREAEREACDATIRHGCYPTMHWTRWRDETYPSLLPTSPPPLVLANGTEITKARECGYNIATPNCRWRNVGVSAIGRHATTAEDFIAIAQWLQETPHV